MSSQNVIEEQKRKFEKLPKSFVNAQLHSNQPFDLQRIQREINESNQKFKIFQNTIDLLYNDMETSMEVSFCFILAFSLCKTNFFFFF